MSNLHYANEVAFQNFKHLEVKVVPEQNAVWLYFDSQPRSCFTLTLLQELDEFQSILKNRNGTAALPPIAAFQNPDVEKSARTTAMHPIAANQMIW